MKTLRFNTISRAIRFGLAGLAVAFAGQAAAYDPAQPTDIIVKLKNGESVSPIAARHHLTVVDQFGKRPIYRLQVQAGASLDQALADVRADARVDFAEKNFEQNAPEFRRTVVWELRTVVWELVASQGQYTGQWAAGALQLTNAQTAARVNTPGLPAGSGIRVAVLDTGIDKTHPAFAGKLLGGWDFVDDDNDPSEGPIGSSPANGHGTHVSGVIARIAPGAKIMPMRVLDNAGKGNTWVLAEAIMRAVDPDGNPNTDDGAHIINLSLGTTQPTRLLNTVVELASCSDDDDNEAEDDYSDSGFDDDVIRCNTQHGTVVVAAAGNAGSDSQVQFPAAEHAKGALAVTSFSQNGRLSNFSNRGPWVQVAAPGNQIVSALPGGLYGSWSGTSMATPMVAGVAALVLQRNPDWKPEDVTKRITERAGTLCGSTIPRLNAWAAVADFVPSPTVCN